MSTKVGDLPNAMHAGLARDNRCADIVAQGRCVHEAVRNQQDWIPSPTKQHTVDTEISLHNRPLYTQWYAIAPLK